jgi:hypothetical protein
MRFARFPCRLKGSTQHLMWPAAGVPLKRRFDTSGTKSAIDLADMTRLAPKVPLEQRKSATKAAHGSRCCAHHMRSPDNCAKRGRSRPAVCPKTAQMSVSGPRCSLRVTGVGCPEHAQVGPLPWLSKSRLRGVPAKSKISWGPLAGIWSASRTPGSRSNVCWATRTCPQPFGSETNTTGPASWAGPPVCAALPVALRRPDLAPRA